LNSVVDEYRTSRFTAILNDLDDLPFTRVQKCSSKTYGELVALLAGGHRDNEVCAMWDISRPTLKILIGEVQDYLIDIGWLDEQYSTD
jgi:hypothetical protein